MNKRINIFTVLGVLAAVYITARYLIPAIINVTATLLLVLFYVFVILAVIVLVLYIIGTVSRRTRNNKDTEQD